jgi:ankyrin repeat protein
VALDYKQLAFLLQRGADVNARSALGNSTLMLAARRGIYHRAVELPLSHGADARPPTISGDGVNGRRSGG